MECVIINKIIIIESIGKSKAYNVHVLLKVDERGDTI